MDSRALLLSQCYSLIDNYNFAAATSLSFLWMYMMVRIDTLDITDENKLELKCLVLLYRKRPNEVISLIGENTTSTTLNEYHAIACLYEVVLLCFFYHRSSGKRRPN